MPQPPARAAPDRDEAARPGVEKAAPGIAQPDKTHEPALRRKRDQRLAGPHGGGNQRNALPRRDRDR